MQDAKRPTRHLLNLASGDRVRLELLQRVQRDPQDLVETAIAERGGDLGEGGEKLEREGCLSWLI